MSFRRLPTTFFFAAFFVLVVLLAGCGGQPDGASQDDSSGETQNQESSGGGQTSVETKMAIGRVADAGVEGRRLVARSNTGDQGAQRMVFVVTKNARITLDGQEATLEAAQKARRPRSSISSKMIATGRERYPCSVRRTLPVTVERPDDFSAWSG